MKILICDDERDYVLSLSKYIKEYMNRRCISCNITLSSDPVEIFRNGEVYDLAFLDIQMEYIDGISLAKELKSRNSKLALFFVTNFNEYQDEAMDLRAFRYFDKPLNVVRLYAGLDKAMEYIDGAYVDVFLSGDGVQRRIVVDDIMYITREGRKTSVVKSNEKIISKEGFDELCERLPNSFFYHVHKSFFVNLHYVQRYTYSELILTDGTRISIASRKQAAFHKFWFEYLKRR